MEQVKLILTILKKYHFWILAVVALALAFWFYPKASATAQKQFDTRKKAIESAKNSAASVANDSNHPNDKRIEEWKKLHTIQKHKVLEGWQLLYNKQKKENPWPSILSNEFRATVKQLGTFDEIPRNYRSDYWMFIGDALPHIWKIVDYRRQLGPDGKLIDDMIGKKGGRSGRQSLSPYTEGNNSKWVGVVDWDVDDRLRIQEEFNFASLPSSLNVRLAQESYWVYQALANIIKRTNGAAKTQSSAVVKAIHAMEIGQAASAFFKSDTRLSLVPGVEIGAKGETDEGGGESKSMLGDVELSNADLALLNTRYVNEALVPQAAGEHPYAEFKMMPIRLRVSVDQRKLPDLLVECANSSMPVEVRQLRLNPEKALILNKESSSGESAKAQYSLTNNTSSSGSKKDSSSYGSEEKKSSYEIEVEIRGIIYIYNPPDLKQLGTGAVTEASLEQGKAEAKETVAAAEAALNANADDSQKADNAKEPAKEKAPAESPANETDQPAKKNSDGDSQ